MTDCGENAYGLTLALRTTVLQLFRALEDKQILSKTETEQVLIDALTNFNGPERTDYDLLAAASINRLFRSSREDRTDGVCVASLGAGATMSELARA